MKKNLTNYFKLFLKDVKQAFSENKYIILTITILFFFFIILGYFVANIYSNAVNTFMSGFIQHVKSVPSTSPHLFLNNLTTACFLFIGSLLLGIAGIFEIFVSSFSLGVLASMMEAKGNLLLYVLLLIPHGIFEIPALIIASSSGFVMLSFVIKFIKTIKSPDKEYLKVLDSSSNLNKLSTNDKIKMSWAKNKFKFKQSVILFIVCVILLVIAAIVEGNITEPLGLAIYGFLT